MQDYGVREQGHGVREQDYGVREKVWFDSGGTECAAWHYPGTNGGCVIMAGGFAVTKEPGTDLFAKRFHEAGFSVLAFDYRHLGESGGQPRQVVRVREQLSDWFAAIDFAGRLPGVDPARLAIWAFSASGGYVFRLAARRPGLAAAGFSEIIRNCGEAVTPSHQSLNCAITVSVSCQLVTGTHGTPKASTG